MLDITEISRYYEPGNYNIYRYYNANNEPLKEIDINYIILIVSAIG
jgi:hypothetical protein